jgi:hypothetical protein
MWQPSIQQKQAMYVTNVEMVEFVKNLIPVRVRFERDYRFNDLFAGDLYLSICNGTYKSLFCLGEGKGNSFGRRSFAFAKSEHRQVQGRTQIVNGIANDDGKFGWDGYVGFSSHHGCSGLWLNDSDKLKRFLGQKGINLPVHIIDVMLGPLEGSPRETRFSRGAVNLP